LIGGLCEVIERDSFMISWQARMGRKQIRRDTLSAQNIDLIQRLEATGVKITLFDLTMDNRVPAVMAVQTHDAHEMPAISLACSAALDAEEAVRKALEEITHTARWMFYLKSRNPDFDPGPGYQNVSGQEQHLIFWADHARRHLADFIFDNTESISFKEMESHGTGEPTQDLAVLVGLIKDTGHTPLAVDITPPDVAMTGLHVVRALIPGYHPLIMGYPIRALGGERLWSVPQALGYRGIDCKSGDNPIPHPFP